MTPSAIAHSSQPMKDALAWLEKEFPGAALYEVRLEFRFGERPGVTDSSASWVNVDWYVQVNNDRACGDSLELAGADLRKRLALKVQTSERATRIAEILREIPRKGFERGNALDEAQRLLEEEELRSR
jgi:hypothetical protein